jgi:hypothetical protein
MPLGIKMINKIPYVVSLKNSEVDIEVIDNDGEMSVVEQTPDQRSLVLRGVYFLLVGWWASGIWMTIAWGVSVSVIGLPVAIWMYGKLPAVVSLYRY